MRVAYFTYWGNIGTTVLEWLATSSGDEIVAVISRPGKEGEAIKDVAFRHYLPLYQPPVNVNDPGFIESLRRLEPDLSVSMYFGRLFSPELLSVPRMGCVNMHPTLLPKY
ncbi:MAG: formyltransferase family protein, partial [Candidatus Latescibacteria bacterium]|nr:formyltransferase family protein [Candidatus Latescibacterota bacterium]